MIISVRSDEIIKTRTTKPVIIEKRKPMKKFVAMIALFVAVAGVSACGNADGTYDSNKPVYSDNGTAGATGNTPAAIQSAEPVFQSKTAK